MSQELTLREALISALEWIDAVPANTPLPGMPGFDRDEVDALLARTHQPEAAQQPAQVVLQPVPYTPDDRIIDRLEARDYFPPVSPPPKR